MTLVPVCSPCPKRQTSASLGAQLQEIQGPVSQESQAGGGGLKMQSLRDADFRTLGAQSWKGPQKSQSPAACCRTGWGPGFQDALDSPSTAALPCGSSAPCLTLGPRADVTNMPGAGRHTQSLGWGHSSQALPSNSSVALGLERGPWVSSVPGTREDHPGARSLTDLCVGHSLVRRS